MRLTWMLVFLAACTGTPGGAAAPPQADIAVRFVSETGSTEPGGQAADVAATVPTPDAKDWENPLPPCGDETVDLLPVDPAHVLLVMDRSSSMAEGQKWPDAQAAVGTALAATDQTLSFGLLMYPQTPQVCAMAAVADVGFAVGNGATIVTAMADGGISMGTPTGSALRAAREILEATGGSGSRVVVLATDGAPTCPDDCSLCAEMATGGCPGGGCADCVQPASCATEEALHAVDGLTAAGIPTYVVGISGSGDAANVLNALAIRGGTAQEGTPRYYPTESSEELAQALAAIAGSVEGCSAVIAPTPGYAYMVVTVDGAKVAKDATHQEGWDLVDGQTLQFYGAACEAASKATAAIQITYVCKYAP